MTRQNCAARQYSDQMQCGPCGLTWDMNDDDDPPPCAPDDPKATGRAALQAMRRIVEGRRDDVACRGEGGGLPDNKGFRYR